MRSTASANTLAVIAMVVCVAMLTVITIVAPRASDAVRSLWRGKSEKQLSASDKIIARMINAVNHDMRSLDLGWWFVNKLALAGGSCAQGVDVGFVDQLPGANQVTRAELRGHATELAAEACALSDRERTTFADALKKIGTAALDPDTGVLATMPGYTVKSAVPLP